MRCFNNHLSANHFALFMVFFLHTLSLTVQATDVYMTRDKDGNPVFSDQPSTGAEKIIIEDVQIIPSSKPITTSPSTGKIKELPKYTNLTIISPKNDESIRENSGAMSIQLSLEPELRGRDVVTLLMDGKVVAEGRQLSFDLNNVDRGSHVLQAAVTSADGNKLIQSQSITVHLQRISVITSP